MRTHFSLEYDHREDLPPGYDDEVRTPDALVERFLREYSEQGDRVIDPFAGFGTTLKTAERLGRVPVGIEYEPALAAHIEDELATTAHVRQGSVLELEPGWVPACQSAFTSPPFMEQRDERDPFQNYTGESSYGQYLDDVETAFARLAAVLEPGSHVVVDIANMKHEGHVTTLAWDVADRIRSVLDFEGEVVVTWEGGDEYADRPGTYGYGYDHSYCLVFRKSAA